MTHTAIHQGQPFSTERTAAIITDFKRDGYVVIPSVLQSDEVAALRQRTDDLFADPALAETGYIQNDFILRHCNELDPLFCKLLVREPIFSLMEAIFGKGFQQCGMNVLRTNQSNAIDRWHVDDALFFPLPDELSRHDPRIEMPIFWLTVQVALSDIETPAHGPTQYVPGSHYSGRHPLQDTPQFEDTGPRDILCKAGDIYLHNSQCWHRGMPNSSERVRYLLQQQYGPRWAFPRYNAYIRYDVPNELLKEEDERLAQVLGDHRLAPDRRYK
ncbi:MAG: ectoine hydroxylase-related dioxygenase (phytanoyl-CoA dioxygenase family) [Candidatus Latescibacterota bacterium]|jgi:ectoine hydroxylase-related dioxygenase (phytanoyl-CoA dioxygenase family)